MRKRTKADKDRKELYLNAALTDVYWPIAAIMLLIVALLIILVRLTEGEFTSYRPPGPALRIQAMRDLNLQGGPVTDGHCVRGLFPQGVRVGDQSHFTRNAQGQRVPKPEFEHLYRGRGFECSTSDHDIFIRYVAPNGQIFNVRPHGGGVGNSANGAFSYVVPMPLLAAAPDYNDELINRNYRYEEVVYTRAVLSPGRYYMNVHLSAADAYLPDDVHMLAVYVVAYEGTPQATVLFNDAVPLSRANTPDAPTRRTVVVFDVDEEGNIIPASIRHDVFEPM
jgi:hypothetical protein